MNNLNLRSVLSVFALFIFIFLAFYFYENLFTDKASKKLDDIQIKNLLKNIKNDADLYYADNQSYGRMPESIENTKCGPSDTFLENTMKQKIFSKINMTDIRCVFEGGGKIDRWSVTLKSSGKYFCIDTTGNVEALDSFTQSISCN